MSRVHATFDDEGNVTEYELRGPKFLSAPKESSRAERKVEGSLTLPFAPIAEALRDVPSEPEWAWEGYLAPGALSLLAGRPKVGKSTLLFGLLEALSTGAPFLDRKTRANGVLLLSEERHGTLAEKQQRFSLNGSVHLLMRHQIGEAPWPDVVAEAAAHCRAQGFNVLCVDTFSEWSKLAGDSENASGAILTALAPLQLAASEGLAVLIVVHQRKALGAFGEAVRGSNALTGAVDVIVELERPGNDVAAEGARVLHALSRYESTPEQLVAVLEAEGYRSGGDLLQLRSAAECDRILEALGAHTAPVTAKVLAEELEIPEGTVRKRLDELGDEVVRTGEGKRGSPFEFLSARANPLGAERKEAALQLSTESYALDPELDVECPEFPGQECRWFNSCPKDGCWRAENA